LDSGAVVLVGGEALEVDAVLLAVDADNLEVLAVLLGLVATDNTDGVTLADGDRRNVVLGLELLGEGRRHDDAALRGGSSKVCLAELAHVGRHGLIVLCTVYVKEIQR